MNGWLMQNLWKIHLRKGKKKEITEILMDTQSMTCWLICSLSNSISRQKNKQKIKKEKHIDIKRNLLMTNEVKTVYEKNFSIIKNWNKNQITSEIFLNLLFLWIFYFYRVKKYCWRRQLEMKSIKFIYFNEKSLSLYRE